MRNELKRNHCSSVELYDKTYQDIALKRPDLSDMLRPSRLKPSYWAVKEILNYVSPPCNVLDIGCLDGKNAFILALLQYNVTAIDIAPKFLERAKKNTSSIGNAINYELLHVEDIKKLNTKFDVILCLSVLEHVIDFDKAFNNVMNALNSKGIALCIVPIEKSWMEGGHVRIFTDKNIYDYFPKKATVTRIDFSDNVDQLGWYAIKLIKE